MASYTPCTGTKKPAVSLQRYPSTPSPTPGGGETWSKAKTFGKCPECDYTVMSYGVVASITVARHKHHTRES